MSVKTNTKKDNGCYRSARKKSSSTVNNTLVSSTKGRSISTGRMKGSIKLRISSRGIPTSKINQSTA